MTTDLIERIILDAQGLPELRDDLPRFLSKVRFTDGCWEWMAGRAKAGYGLFHSSSRTRDHRTVSAHRFVYEALVGAIPVGLTLDHLCHNADPNCMGGRACLHRRCVNPGHLEPVTQRINILRGATIPAARARQTHCVQGHLFDEANTHYKRDGTRDCRACNRERARHRTGYYERRSA